MADARTVFVDVHATVAHASPCAAVVEGGADLVDEAGDAHDDATRLHGPRELIHRTLKLQPLVSQKLLSLIPVQLIS